MALMERVATLLRANVADLIDRAEDPEKALKQLVVDMQNQLLQVKTQVAMALADQYLLEKRAKEQEEIAADWQQKAELAVRKRDDGQARAALERALHHKEMLGSLHAQVTNQAIESEAVRVSYLKLHSKLLETQTRCDVLITEHRRPRMICKATGSRTATEGKVSAVSTSQHQSRRETANGLHQPPSSAGRDPIADSFKRAKQNDRVEQLLADLTDR